MAKKVYKLNFLLVIVKNLNWETIHLVTFKRWDEVKDEKF